MRTIIAGGRDINDLAIVTEAMAKCGWTPTVVLSGAARGVDRLGEMWAALNHITVESYPANWGEHGKAAGPIRNRQMAEKGEALVAVWDGKSRGTKNMIDTAHRLGLHVYVHRI